MVRMDLTVMENAREKFRGSSGARAEVGLFASKASRGKPSEAPKLVKDKKTLTNPALGLIHEFGSTKKNIPERSWLRMPLINRLFSEVKGVNWIYIILTKGMPFALALLGAKAEVVIHKAFRTRGFGIWPILKKATILRKGHSAILIETTQMEKAISSRVVIP
jgi:hypothetical protein